MKPIKIKKNSLFIIIFFNLIFSQEWQMLYPCDRHFSRFIVDTLNKRVILFSGGSYRYNEKWYNDVWEIPLIDTNRYFWLPIKIRNAPIAGRGGHLFIYVPLKQMAIVFGGDTLWGSRVNDVWSLDLNLGAEKWERLYPSGSPPGRRSVMHGIYHPMRNSIIFFGGTLNSPYGDTNDVWELKLDTLKWQEIITEGIRPPKRSDHCAIFDKENNRMIIFGGGGEGNFYNDLWALDLTPGQERWTRLNPAGEIPEGRCGFAHGYDEARKKLYIFGGWRFDDERRFFNDVYVLELQTLYWRKIIPSGEAPTGRRNAAGVFDPFNNRFIIFGGDDYWYYYNDTYILNMEGLDTPEWKRLRNFFPTIFVTTPTTDLVKIRYILPEVSHIRVEIIDVNGRLVRTLFSGKPPSTTGWLFWDRKDEKERKVNSGIYYCRLTTNHTSFAQKIIIVDKE